MIKKGAISWLMKQFCSTYHHYYYSVFGSLIKKAPKQKLLLHDVPIRNQSRNYGSILFPDGEDNGYRLNCLWYGLKRRAGNKRPPQQHASCLEVSLFLSAYYKTHHKVLWYMTFVRKHGYICNAWTPFLVSVFAQARSQARVCHENPMRFSVWWRQTVWDHNDLD